MFNKEVCNSFYFWCHYIQAIQVVLPSYVDNNVNSHGANIVKFNKFNHLEGERS